MPACPGVRNGPGPPQHTPRSDENGHTPGHGQARARPRAQGRTVVVGAGQRAKAEREADPSLYQIIIPHAIVL